MSACVSREVLHAVAAGGSVPGGAPLDAAAIAAVHDHLDDCAACASQMLEVVRQGAVLAAGSDQSATWDVGDAGASGGLDAAALPPGTTLGRFVVRDVLGSGNMGTVFTGWDPQLARPVAIKVLRAGRSGEAADRRLLREAKAMAQVRHPNVVTVFDVGEDKGVIFVAMEHIAGQTLRGALADRPAPTVVLGWLRQVASGLASIHAAGLVHRDIKPDNLFVEHTASGPRVVVGDFGLAVGTAAEPAARRVSTTSIATRGAGTPAYMAPEQLTAGEVGAAADVFAFGVTAWELLCGRRPFQGATLAVLLEQIEAGPREPLVAPGVAREALAMITACLRAEPRDRPASMLVVKAALEDGRGRRVGRGLVIAAGLGGTAAVAMAAVLLVGGGTGAPAVAPPACDATRAPWWESAGWPARAAASGALSTARIDAVRKVMDQRAAAWRTHAAATCAGGLMAQQAWTWCRERVEGAERALLDAAIASPWPDGDAAVSVRLTGLDLPADCGTREAGEYAIAVGALPAPQRQRVPEVLADLERAGVAMARGDAAGAQALVARWQADPELAGAAFLQEELALVGAMLGADPTATVDKARALAAISERAARSGSSSLVARASLLVVDAALGRSDSELVRRHLAQADWAIARIGEPPRLRTRWHLSVGNVALNEGRWPDAVAAYRAAAEAASQDPLLTGWRTAALARVSSALGSDADAVQAYRAFLGSGGLADLEPLERVTLLLELAEALYRLGRLDDALAELTRADAAMPAGATGVVPRLRVEVVRASIETDQEHFEAARDRLDGVRATIQREVPDEVALLADVELRLAYTLLLLQEIDRCVAMARSAAATFATLDGEATAGGASAESLIGEALALQGKRAEAAVALASAVRQAERVYGAEHPMVAQLRPPLARALATLDRRAEAITQLELALAAFAKTEFAPEAIAEAEFELARLVLKMDRPRALALAAAAEARLVGPANARQRAEVAAWRKRPR